MIIVSTKPYTLLIDDGHDTSVYVVGGEDERGAIENFLCLYGTVHPDVSFVRIMGVCPTFEDPEDNT